MVHTETWLLLDHRFNTSMNGTQSVSEHWILLRLSWAYSYIWSSNWFYKGLLLSQSAREMHTRTNQVLLNWPVVSQWLRGKVSEKTKNSVEKELCNVRFMKSLILGGHMAQNSIVSADAVVIFLSSAHVAKIPNELVPIWAPMDV